VKLGRVRDLVERSLGALLVSRTGRRDCADLDGILGDWDGTLTPLVRKRVARHIETCPVCGERKRSMVNPLALLAAVPLVPAPPSLRDHVLGDIQRISSTRSLPWHREGVGRIVIAALVILAVIGVAIVSRADEPTSTITTTTTSSTTTSSTSTTTPAVTRPRPATVTTRVPATTTTVPPTTTTTPGRTTTTSSTTTTSPRTPGGP
jgi:hypothetical protein